MRALRNCELNYTALEKERFSFLKTKVAVCSVSRFIKSTQPLWYRRGAYLWHPHGR